MRLRNLLAATTASALLVAGLTGTAAHADPLPNPDAAGSAVVWGKADDVNVAPAMALPETLTSPVVDISTTANATALVTLDGHLTVLAGATSPLLVEAPTEATDAVSVSVGYGNVGAIIHADGTVSAWGPPGSPLAEVPTDLRTKAVAVSALGVGYAVRPDGTLTTWGTDPTEIGMPLPAGLTDLVDVSAGTYQMMALKADGTVITWGFTGLFPEFNEVPDFGGKKATQIATSSDADGVVLDDGTIRVWGTAIPTGQPTLEGEKVVSLSLGSGSAGVVTDVGGVHTWGSSADVKTIPAALTGKPVAAISVGEKHAVVIVTTFRTLTKASISGTPQVGQTLTAAPATFSLTPTAPATGQWFANAVPIAGQTGATLALDDSLVDSAITYHSSATRDGVTATSVSDEVSVAKGTTMTTLTVTPATAAAGKARVATATVTRPGGTPGGTVTFKVGTTTRIMQLSGGKASWTLPVLAVGTRQVTATYNGSPSSVGSTATPVNIKVTKAASKVGAKIQAKRSAKKVTITITVATAKGVSPAGKVTVALKGKTKKTVHAQVNANGKAVVTIKKMKRGKHTVTVTYAGNGNVLATHGSKKFKF